MPLGPIAYSGYGFPSVGWGWQSPYTISTPSYFNVSPYSYGSYAPSLGGRYFYGTLFSPSYGGVPFSSYGNNYNYDLMTAGAILSTWGNISEVDPFYRAAYPFGFYPYVPWTPLFVPIPPLFGNPAGNGTAQPAVAQAGQAAQPAGQQGQDHAQGAQDRGGRERRINPEYVEQLTEENRQLREALEQMAEARTHGGGTRRRGGSSNPSEEPGTRREGRNQLR